jgi:hypothetical protein
LLIEPQRARPSQSQQALRVLLRPGAPGSASRRNSGRTRRFKRASTEWSRRYAIRGNPGSPQYDRTDNAVNNRLWVTPRQGGYSSALSQRPSSLWHAVRGCHSCVRPPRPNITECGDRDERWKRPHEKKKGSSRKCVPFMRGRQPTSSYLVSWRA